VIYFLVKFSSPFCKYLAPEVTMICVQVLMNVNAYDPTSTSSSNAKIPESLTISHPVSPMKNSFNAANECYSFRFVVIQSKGTFKYRMTVF